MAAAVTKKTKAKKRPIDKLKLNDKGLLKSVTKRKARMKDMMKKIDK